MAKVACVIPAAGWGSLCPLRSTPKMLASIGGQPMILRVVETVQSAGIKDITVVVGANDFGDQIKTAVSEAGITDISFAVQPERTGAADAVRIALAGMEDAENILVTFGDMPLWRSQTIRDLIRMHMTSGPVISMVTIPYCPGHPTARYGRVARNSSGEILAAFEPFELSGKELPGVASVNPSLYVFKRQWLATAIPTITPTDKGDGFPPELHLPKLLPLAHDQGVHISEMLLFDPDEALGVNTVEELREAQDIAGRRGER